MCVGVSVCVSVCTHVHTLIHKDLKLMDFVLAISLNSSTLHSLTFPASTQSLASQLIPRGLHVSASPVLG